jgi:hypothetical protein
VKKPTLAVCFLTLASPLLIAQNFDIQAARSDEQLRWGIQAYHRGFYSDAMVSLQKSLSILPSNTLAQTWLGRVYFKSGFEQEALATWERMERAGTADDIVRNWTQVIRQRSGTDRDLSRKPVFVVNAELDAGMAGGHPFKRPTSVRSLADGSFYLTAFGTNEVLHYDANFRFLETLRGGLEGFNGPFDVLDMGNGNLYVSEYRGNVISRWNAKGERLKNIGGTGRGEGQLLGPQYLAADGKGFLYVTDWGNARVNKYDLDGNFILSIPGLSGPSGIVVHEDRVFISENGKKRVSIYDPNGNFLRSLGEGTLRSPEGLSFTPEGRLLVADSNTIFEADIENERWTVKADTSSRTRRLIQQDVTPNGDILGVDFDQNLVVFLSDSVSLTTGYVVRVDRVNSVKFPDIFADVSVEDRFGHPIVGLGINNFILTESRRSVGPTTMIRANTGVIPSDIVLLVESSPAISVFRSVEDRAAADLFALATNGGRIKAISAGERPVKETDFGEARLRFLSSAFQAEPSEKWRFDAGARIAGEDLITGSNGAVRAIVFFSSGSLGANAFTTYSLTELAAFMRNNSIAFYPVFFGTKGLSEDLAYLASETGGGSYSVFTPGGMTDVVEDIRARVTPLYSIKYTSPSEAEFGTKYIPLEVEVTMQRMSGRDNCGYFAPPSP